MIVKIRIGTARPHVIVGYNAVVVAKRVRYKTPCGLIGSESMAEHECLRAVRFTAYADIVLLQCIHNQKYSRIAIKQPGASVKNSTYMFYQV